MQNGKCKLKIEKLRIPASQYYLFLSNIDYLALSARGLKVWEGGYFALLAPLVVKLSNGEEF